MMQISVIGAVVLASLMQLGALSHRWAIFWGGILLTVWFWEFLVVLVFVFVFVASIAVASASSATTRTLTVLFTLWGVDHCHALGRSGLLF
jgi:hypothetical protein